MDQAHAKALAALQPFVHLAATTKNPSHRFLADLITRATSAPGTYVFTELLQLPSIQSLRASDTSAESQAYLTVLEIFSWGTYEEYQSTPNLPSLDESQTLKLRQLSLLSIASPFLPTESTSINTLTYPSLLSALALTSTAELESLITSCIYSGLVTANLSPNSTPPAVHIHSVAPLRDLRPQSLPALLRILDTWSSRCDEVVSSLQSNIDNIKSTARARNTLAVSRQDRVDAAVINVHPDGKEDEKKGTRAPRMGAGQRLGSKRDLDADEIDSDDDGMDVDEGIGEMGYLGGASLGNLVSGGGGGGGGGPSRGTKRNRPRG